MARRRGEASGPAALVTRHGGDTVAARTLLRDLDQRLDQAHDDGVRERHRRLPPLQRPLGAAFGAVRLGRDASAFVLVCNHDGGDAHEQQERDCAQAMREAYERVHARRVLEGRGARGERWVQV
eukprot:2539086-Prymnesium_polylepis.1